MRSHRLGALLIVGTLLSLIAVGTLASAGCSSIVAKPGACATAMYDSAKANAGARAGGAQAWASAGPGALLLCPTLAGSLPGTSYNPQPAIDGNVQYVGEQHGAAGSFAAAAPSQTFPATGNFGAAAWANTANVIERWNERLFNPVTNEVLAFLATPRAPDPAQLGSSPGQAAAHVGGTAACVQAAPLPAL